MKFLVLTHFMLTVVSGSISQVVNAAPIPSDGSDSVNRLDLNDHMSQDIDFVFNTRDLENDDFAAEDSLYVERRAAIPKAVTKKASHAFKSSAKKVVGKVTASKVKHNSNHGSTSSKKGSSSHKVSSSRSSTKSHVRGTRSASRPIKLGSHTGSSASRNSRSRPSLKSAKNTGHQGHQSSSFARSKSNPATHLRKTSSRSNVAGKHTNSQSNSYRGGRKARPSASHNLQKHAVGCKRSEHGNCERQEPNGSHSMKPQSDTDGGKHGGPAHSKDSSHGSTSSLGGKQTTSAVSASDTHNTQQAHHHTGRPKPQRSNSAPFSGGKASSPGHSALELPSFPRVPNKSWRQKLTPDLLKNWHSPEHGGPILPLHTAHNLAPMNSQEEKIYKTKLDHANAMTTAQGERWKKVTDMCKAGFECAKWGGGALLTYHGVKAVAPAAKFALSQAAQHFASRSINLDDTEDHDELWSMYDDDDEEPL